jgi:hypothetical protein
VADNCSDAAHITVSYTDSEITATCEGSYSFTRTWRVVDDCGNVSLSDSVQTITVSDTTRPTYERPADITLYKNENCDVLTSTTATGEPTAVQDNCTSNPIVSYSDSELTPICDGGFTFTRTWRVIDDCGNVSLSDSVQTITVLDTVRPTYTRPEDITLYKNEGCNADTSVAATGFPTMVVDNCAATPTVTYTDSELTFSCEGSYSFTRTWRVVTDCGNVSLSDSVQTITVLDTVRPTYTRPADYIVYKDANCNADTSVTAAGEPVNVADNCSDAAHITVSYTDRDRKSVV